MQHSNKLQLCSDLQLQLSLPLPVHYMNSSPLLCNAYQSFYLSLSQSPGLFLQQLTYQFSGCPVQPPLFHAVLLASGCCQCYCLSASLPASCWSKAPLSPACCCCSPATLARACCCSPVPLSTLCIYCIWARSKFVAGVAAVRTFQDTRACNSV